MEPFDIHCTTCQARLVVRDPGAIGQILACPRCGSMVLVQLPAGQAAPRTAVTPPTGGTTAPATASPVPPVAGTKPPLRRSVSGDADTMPDTFDDLDNLLAGHTPGPASGIPSSLPTPTAPAAAAGERAATSPATAASASAPLPAEPSRRLSPAMIVLFAGGAGIFLAVTVSVALITWFGRKADTVVATANENGQPGSPTPTDDDNHSIPAVDSPATDETFTETTEPNDTGSPAKRAPTEPGSPATESDTDPSDTKSAATDKPEAPDGFIPKPDEVRTPTKPLAGKFSDLLNGGSVTPENAGSPDAPLASKPVDPPHERPALPRPLMREIDIPARLADSLAAVAYHDAPLVDFVHEISDLSTIPISLDLDALRLKQLSVVAPVSVKLQSATIEQLLAAALEPYKLVTVVESDSQLMVTLPGDEASRHKADYSVEDLTGGDADLTAALLQQVQQWTVPDAWTAAGGTATIEASGNQFVVEGPDRVHLELQWLLDKLRLARQLKPQHKFVPEITAPDSVESRCAAKLKLPVKLNFARPTRLTAVLQRLGRETGTRIVANWQSLATIGWTTETQVTLTVDGQSLQEALVALTEPMELTYRVVDDATIEILTPQTASTRLQVELFTTGGLVAGPADADRLIARLEMELGAGSLPSNGGQGTLGYDARSGCLIASLPEVHQRAVARLLATWRADAGRAGGDSPAP